MSVAFFVSGLMHLRKQLVLASQSPRRLSLLRQLGLNPTVMPPDVDELFDASFSPAENVERIALHKAEAVAKKVANGIVLAADTTVVLDSNVLGKPVDADDAAKMLQQLSGKTHIVHTGFALIDTPGGKSISGTESTEVTFRELPADEIAEYIAGGSPLDKAGAYGIQDDYGAVFVTGIRGCFYTVVGLPLSRIHSALLDLQLQLEER